MKNIIYTTFVIFIFSTLVQAQVADFETYSSNNAIIYLKTNPTNGVKLGDSKSTVINLFGQPNTTQTAYSEMDEANMDVFIYGNSQLTFLFDRLISLEVPNFTDSPFTIGNATVKLTSSSSAVAALFGYAGDRPMRLSKDGVFAVLVVNEQKQDQCLVLTWTSHDVKQPSSPKGAKKKATKETYTVIDKIRTLRLYED